MHADGRDIRTASGFPWGLLLVQVLGPPSNERRVLTAQSFLFAPVFPGSGATDLPLVLVSRGRCRL